MLSQTRKRLFNLIGLSLLGAAAGYLVFWQLQRRDDAAEQKEAGERLFDIADLQTIDSVTLATAVGEVKLERGVAPGAEWQVVSPLATLAEQSTVEALVRQVGTVKRLRPVGEKQGDGTVTPPTELWMFGLAPPRFSITLVERTGASHQLLIGKRNNFDGSIYVKRGDGPDISLVEGGVEYQVNKDLYQLRDKRLVTFSEEAVHALTVSRPTESKGYAVVRDGEGFRLTSPVSAAADQAQVEGLISALVNVRAKAFVAEAADAPALAQFGLHQPVATMAIELGDGRRLSAQFSQLKAGETTFLYATLGLGQPVLELSSDWLVKKILVDAEAMRDKRVLLFARERVAGLNLRRGDKSLSLRKGRDAEKERDVWRITAPEERPADAATVTGLLYRLSNLKAERVVVEEASDAQMAEYSLAQPEVSLELVDDAGAVLVGASFAKGPMGEWYASASGRSRVDLVEPSMVKDLSVEPADYQEPELDTD